MQEVQYNAVVALDLVEVFCAMRCSAQCRCSLQFRVTLFIRMQVDQYIAGGSAGVALQSNIVFRRMQQEVQCNTGVALQLVFSTMQEDLCNAGVQCNAGFQYNAGGSVQRRRGCRGSGENCFVNAALIAATTYRSFSTLSSKPLSSSASNKIS